MMNELKQQVIDALNLDLTPEQIDDNAPLFGDEGLGLDSIDVLELIVLLERQYGIKITNPKEGKDVFVDFKTMHEYIEQHRTK